MVDQRRVYLSPAALGQWKFSDPGVFHTSAGCAGRGSSSGAVDVYLERAVKEGYEACGICAAGITHDFEAAAYP